MYVENNFLIRTKQFSLAECDIFLSSQYFINEFSLYQILLISDSAYNRFFGDFIQTMKSVTFLLSFLISLVPDLVAERKKFKKLGAAKRKPTHSLVTSILNSIIGSELIHNNDEIDQEKISDYTVSLNIRKKIVAFLSGMDEKLIIAVPGRARRRSHGQLAPIVQTRAPKQTRYQSSKCDSLNCEWKTKFNKVTDKNNELKEEVATLKVKLDSFRSQSSQSSQQSTQTNDSFVHQTTIPLLEIEQEGCVRRYSTDMFRLGIILIVACNLSCEIIPDVLSAILTAAQIRHLNLPKTGFFLKIRSMLRPLNETQLQSFCNQAERITICFDESSFKTKIGAILAISVMNEKAEQKIVSIIEHNERSSTVKKHLIDVKVIMKSLADSLGETHFKPTMLKTNMILSDNCHAAKSTREAIRKELDDKFPVDFQRHSQKCLVHVSNLSETFIMKELPLLEPFLRKIAPLLSKPLNAATQNLHSLWTGQRIVYHHGTRFFSSGSNALACFVSFDLLKTLMQKCQKTSIGAAEILTMIENPELYKQLAIMSRLSIFVKELWRCLTVKQSKRDLVQTIDKIRSQIELVSSETFSLDEIAEHLPRNNEIDEKAHEKFLSEFSNDEAIQSQVREIFVLFTTKIYELVNPYMVLVDLEQEDDSEEDSGINSDDHEVIDPANIGIERCFGMLKFFEERFKSLTFGALSQLTIAKCNELTDHLSEISDEDLLKANRSARQDQRASRESVLHQRDMIRSNNERRLIEVIEVIFASFFISF